MGINTSHKGLSVRLLRSASLLGLLHLYRFIFVVGMLQVRQRYQAPHIALVMLVAPFMPSPASRGLDDMTDCSRRSYRFVTLWTCNICEIRTLCRTCCSGYQKTPLAALLHGGWLGRDVTWREILLCDLLTLHMFRASWSGTSAIPRSGGRGICRRSGASWRWRSASSSCTPPSSWR